MPVASPENSLLSRSNNAMDLQAPAPHQAANEEALERTVLACFKNGIREPQEGPSYALPFSKLEYEDLSQGISVKTFAKFLINNPEKAEHKLSEKSLFCFSLPHCFEIGSILYQNNPQSMLEPKMQERFLALLERRLAYEGLVQFNHIANNSGPFSCWSSEELKVGFDENGAEIKINEECQYSGKLLSDSVFIVLIDTLNEYVKTKAKILLRDISKGLKDISIESICELAPIETKIISKALELESKINVDPQTPGSINWFKQHMRNSRFDLIEAYLSTSTHELEIKDIFNILNSAPFSNYSSGKEKIAASRIAFTLIKMHVAIATRDKYNKTAAAEWEAEWEYLKISPSPMGDIPNYILSEDKMSIVLNPEHPFLLSVPRELNRHLEIANQFMQDYAHILLTCYVENTPFAEKCDEITNRIKRSMQQVASLNESYKSRLPPGLRKEFLVSCLRGKHRYQKELKEMDEFKRFAWTKQSIAKGIKEIEDQKAALKELEEVLLQEEKAVANRKQVEKKAREAALANKKSKKTQPVKDPLPLSEEEEVLEESTQEEKSPSTVVETPVSWLKTLPKGPNLASRVKQWASKQTPDLIRSINPKLYSSFTDEQCMEAFERHHFPGLVKTLLIPEFLNVYYAETSSGFRFLAELIFEGERIPGFITIGIGREGKVYHQFFEEIPGDKALSFKEFRTVNRDYFIKEPRKPSDFTEVRKQKFRVEGKRGENLIFISPSKRSKVEIHALV